MLVAGKALCRSQPKPKQIKEPKRKRRKDAKYASHAERQRAYQARHSTADFPHAVRDLLWMKERRARMAARRIQEPVEAIKIPDRQYIPSEQILSTLSVRGPCVSIEKYVLHDQVPLSTMTGVIASGQDCKTQSHPLPGAVLKEIFEQAFGFSYGFFYTNQVGMDLHAIPFSLG
jgi:hypothetical protein